MKKKINKKDIPGYAYGASEVVGAVTNGLAATMPYATSGKATVGTALGGMASGAAAGAALGPWGAVAGAAIGGIMGSIGSGGSVDEYTGEITNPSGIAGLFGHSKGYLQRKSNRIKNSNIGRQMTDALRADYYNNSMAEYNPNTFAEGGIVPTTLGWVDDGEFGRNPDGTLWEEPEEGKPTDSNLRRLEVGAQIWSDKEKNPQTKNTFATDAKNIAKKYKTKGTDKYAETTRSLNEIQMHKELDDLMALQESVKMKKKSKNSIPAYEGGKDGKEELAAEIAARKMAGRSKDDYFLYRKKDGTFVMQDIDGKQYDVPEMMLPYIQGDEHGYWFGPQTGVAPSAGKWNGSMNFAKQILNSKNVAKLRNTMTKVLPRGAKPATQSTVGKGVNAAQAQKESMLNNDRTFQMWQRLGNKGGLPAKTVESNVAAYRDASKASRNLLELTPAQQAAANASAEQYIYDGMVKSNLPYWLALSGIIGGGGTFLTYEATKDKKAAPIPTSPAATQDTPVVESTTETPDNVANIPAATENTTEATTATTSKKGTIAKPGSKKTVSRVTTSTATSPEDTVVRRPVYEEPVKTATVSPDDTKIYGRDGSVRYDYAIPEIKRNDTNNGTTNSTKFNWSDTLGYIGQLAAPIANIIEGSKDTEPVDPVYVTPTFGRVSIDPRNALRHIRNTQGLTNYNADNLGGAGMAYSLQNALNTNSAISDLYSNVYDKEVGLSFTNANIANDIARYNADAKRAVNEAYAQNKASRHNMKMTGISQLGHLSGQIPRDIKLNRNNTALTKATEKWLAQYMPKADVNELFNILNYGR